MITVRFRVGLNYGDTNKPIEGVMREAMKENAMRRAGRMFGGCNVTRGWGSWMNGEELIVEDCLNIDIVTVEHNELRIHDYAHYLREEFQQKAISVTYFNESESFMATKEPYLASA
jgi:hypothetical protein